MESQSENKEFELTHKEKEVEVNQKEVVEPLQIDTTPITEQSDGPEEPTESINSPIPIPTKDKGKAPLLTPTTPPNTNHTNTSTKNTNHTTKTTTNNNAKSPLPPFQLKPLHFQNQTLKIITQNKNGSCPLISLCNLLILTKQIDISYDMEMVSVQYLLSLLVDLLLQKENCGTSVSKEGEGGNGRELEVYINTMEQLQTGIDLNIGFDSIFSFEQSQQVELFHIFGVTLCHGWIPDPESDVYHILFTSGNGGSKSDKEGSSKEGSSKEGSSKSEFGVYYNQVVEKILEIKSMSDIPLDINQLSLSQTTQEHLYHTKEQESSTSSTSNSNSNPMKNTTLQQNALLIEQFLNETSTQLSYYGLSTLGSTLPPHSLSIFFRNNHLNVLYKRPITNATGATGTTSTNGGGSGMNDGEYELLQLVTDEGFLDTRVCWETLESVEGESRFYTESFLPIDSLSGHGQSVGQSLQSVGQSVKSVGQSVGKTVGEKIQAVGKSVSHAVSQPLTHPEQPQLQPVQAVENTEFMTDEEMRDRDLALAIAYQDQESVLYEQELQREGIKEGGVKEGGREGGEGKKIGEKCLVM